MPAPVAEPAGELLLARVDGCADGSVALGVAGALVAAGAAEVLGRAAPPTGLAVRETPDGPCDGTRLTAGVPVAGDPPGDWFVAGVLRNTPESSSAMRAPLAATATPSPMTARRRWFPPGRLRPGGLAPC